MNNTDEFELIMGKLENIETMIIKMTDKKEVLKGSELMDNTDMCLLLGITKRTLQRYRQKGVLPYYLMSGKSYYKPEEVQECLKRIMKDKRPILKPKNS